MVRVDDPDRVFDVSRPGRTAAGATSRPLVVGHRPKVVDPMVHEDNPYAEFGEEKKVTSVPVTWDAPEENAPAPAANDFGGNSTFEESAPQDHAVATEPEVDVETKATNHENRPSVDTLFAPDNHADKSSWTGDGQPPVTALPLAHSAGAGPRRSVKKMLAWLATFLVLAAVGAFLAIDAGLVGANIKLPFEIFKEKAVPVSTPQPTPQPSTPEVEAVPPFELPAGWTAYENKTLGVKFAYPKDWSFVDKSSTQNGIKSWDIGELTSKDKKTTVAITLIRTKDGRSVSLSLDDWKESASKLNRNYTDLRAIESPYTAFSYVLNVDTATSLNYVVLVPDHQVDLIALPTSTDQKANLDLLAQSIRID